MKLRDKNCEILDLKATLPNGKNISLPKLFNKEFSQRQVSAMRSRPDFLSFAAHRLSEVPIDFF